MDQRGYSGAMAVQTRQIRPNVDAARLLIELREKRGLAREEVPREMARMPGVNRARIPSPKTLWRIEELGHTPSIGIKAVLADFYGQDLHAIWPPHVPRCARPAARVPA